MPSGMWVNHTYTFKHKLQKRMGVTTYQTRNYWSTKLVSINYLSINAESYK